MAMSVSEIASELQFAINRLQNKHFFYDDLLDLFCKSR
jgi:hypothetical protein